MSTLPHGENSGDDQPAEDSGFKKGPWTPEEDAILAAYVTANGVGNWNMVQKNTGLARCGKSCRLRWTNHLRPDLRRGAFSDEEQCKVIELHALLGSRWAKMAQELPGRTDNEIKNFWNTRQKKRRRMGLPLYPDHIRPVLNIDSQQSSLDAFSQHANDSQGGTSSNVPDSIFNNYHLARQEHPLCIPPIFIIPENSTFEQQASDNPIMHPLKQLHVSDINFERQGLDNPIMHPLEQLHVSDTTFEQQGLDNPIIHPLEQLHVSDTTFEQQGSDNPIMHPLEQLHVSNINFKQQGSDNPIMHHPEQLHVSDTLNTCLDSTGVNNATPAPVDNIQFQGGGHECSSGDPPSIPEAPPFSFDDTLTQDPPAETQYNQSHSPRSNGYFESVLYPPKILEGSDHSSIQGESNSENKENLDQRDLANQDVLHNFSWSENYDKDQSALKDTLFGIVYPYFDWNTD